ncbi:MAG: chemotaxis protein CheW [Eubacteriales bacterium]|jgi:purine-binding chemotaxis protein CheW|nr:chemotaxis protein CheW [Eubacteriales bacterium]
MKEIVEDALKMEEDTQKGKFLIFPLGGEDYAIEIKCITEIIGIQPITQVPELPVYVKGIINLRGKIIPVMDVRVRFRMPPVEYNDRTCIIVIEEKDLSVGLIVDNVSEVLSVADEDIVPPPEIKKDGENRYVQAIIKVDDAVKLILDCERLISDKEKDTISQAL